MSDSLTTEQLQAIACGRPRKPASAIITERILYAVRFGSIGDFHKSAMMVECQRDVQKIQAVTSTATFLYLAVTWNGETVWTAECRPSKLFPLEGEVTVLNWCRRPDIRIWQAKLFELFPIVPKTPIRTTRADVAAFLRALLV